MIVAAAAIGGATQGLVPRAHAMPAPEVEYVYDVMVRRHYNFANPDEAIKYGHRICDKISQSESYAQVMGDVKSDVLPNDEFAANYLVSYAVNLLCPAEIWQLRNSAGATDHQQGSQGAAPWTSLRNTLSMSERLARKTVGLARST